MSKQLFLSAAFGLGLLLSMSQVSFGQAKTADELKAEREAVKSEMKSQEATDRREKYEKLSMPKPSGVASVDDLAGNTTRLLSSTKEINATVPVMYKRTIGETVDGVTDVTVKKPTLKELTALAGNINTQISAASAASSAVSGASEDVKNASPLQAPKAAKSLNYSKDVLALVGPELQLSLKVTNHLIETLQSANNN
jgi:phage tail sheath protein FI